MSEPAFLVIDHLPRMNACTNDELGEGVELFPDELDDFASIYLYVNGDPGERAIHLHQGADCLVIVQSLWRSFCHQLDAIASRFDERPA